MINETHAKRYCSEDISLIQNYDKAIADTTQTWDCHHKLEMFMTEQELKDAGRYKKVPARELVFLSRKEHCWWPHKGNEEAKQKLRVAMKGKNNPAYRMHWWNNGAKSIRAKECPVGFKKGRL